ncbi:MAG: autotransporter-associated beta strand repeat-containing protein, partial [Anaerolineae bacterium]|nr:autotransporter-associated beta strand repeat-containing protein [Anaerolineae bacterium]
TKASAGTLVIANNQRYAGGTYVSAGTLVLSNNAGLGSLLTISNGTTVIALAGTGLVAQTFAAAGYSNAIVTLRDLQNFFGMPGLAGYDFTNNQVGFVNADGLLNYPNTVAHLPNQNVVNAVASWQGKFSAPVSGFYQFNTTSVDDYGVIFVDGMRMANNVQVYLDAGAHDITVFAANNTGPYGIAVDLVVDGAIARMPNLLLSGGGAGVNGLAGDAGAQLFLSNGVFHVNQTNDATFAGTITGAGGLRKLGTNTLTLTGMANDFLGGVILSGGRLSVSATNMLGAANSLLTFNGGVLQITGTGMTNLGAHPIYSGGFQPFNGGFDIASAANVFYLSNNIAGLGGLWKYGAGTLVLGGSNDFLGGLWINAGTLRINNRFAVGSVSNTLVMSGGTLDLTNNSVVLGGLTGTGGIITDNSPGAGLTTLAVTNAGLSTTFGGVIADGANGKRLGLTYGAGLSYALSLGLSASNTYTGPTIINGGVLSLTGTFGSINGSTNIIVNPGGTLFIFNGGAGTTNNWRIGDTATLTMRGGTFGFYNNRTANVDYFEDMSNLVIAAGASVLDRGMPAGGGNRSIVAFTNLSRNVGATVLFTATNLGSGSNTFRINQAPPMTNGLIGGWAVAFNGSQYDWATYNSAWGSVSNLPAASYSTLSGSVSMDATWNANSNLLYTTTANDQTLTMIGNRTNYSVALRLGSGHNRV